MNTAISSPTSWPDDFVQACELLYRRHRLPLKMITAFDEREATGSFRIMYLFGVPRENLFPGPVHPGEGSLPVADPVDSRGVHL